MKRVERNITTRDEAERIATTWRNEGFRVGVATQTDPRDPSRYTGLFIVTGTKKR